MHTALLLGLTEWCDDTARRPGCPTIRLARGLMELYEIVCRACSALFYIHRCCYRGHAYCRDACRAVGRRRTANAANRTLRESEEGRLDHLDAERDRRERRREEALRESEPRQEEAPRPDELRREETPRTGALRREEPPRTGALRRQESPRETEPQRAEQSRVGDHGSKNLTQAAHLVGESEVRDEARSDDDAARAGAGRSLYTAAARWDVARGGATSRRGEARAGAGLLERLAGLVCIVCGRGGGPVVPMVDGPDGGHLRAAPGAALLPSTA